MRSGVVSRSRLFLLFSFDDRYDTLGGIFGFYEQDLGGGYVGYHTQFDSDVAVHRCRKMTFQINACRLSTRSE